LFETTRVVSNNVIKASLFY